MSYTVPSRGLVTFFCSPKIKSPKKRAPRFDGEKRPAKLASDFTTLRCSTRPGSLRNSLTVSGPEAWSWTVPSTLERGHPGSTVLDRNPGSDLRLLGVSQGPQGQEPSFRWRNPCP